MTSRVLRSIAAFVLCALAGCTIAAKKNALPSTDPDLRREIESVNRSMEEAMRRNDPAAVAAFYADDGFLLSPGGKRVEGREAIDEYWTSFGTGIDWKLDAFVIEGDRERGLAYQRGRSTLTYERNGGRRTSVVEFLLIWRKAPGGDWRIVTDAYW